MPEIHKRFQNVQIENKDWRYVLDTYDTKNTLFYLDPPYVLSTRVGGRRYECEMEDEEHVKLIDKISNIKGQFVLSGYNNDIYDRLDSYEKHEFQTTCLVEKIKNGEARSKRTECLWIKRHLKDTLF